MSATPGGLRSWAPWALIGVGLSALLIPTWLSLLPTIWSTAEQAHGPFVAVIGAWLMWRQREAVANAPIRPARGLGWICFAFGLLLYVFGRSQSILMAEVGSVIWVVAGALLLIRGVDALKAAGFGLFFLLFMIPLPGALVDSLTQPLKIAVSESAEAILGFVGLPVARSGAVLQVGQYQLLVADACAGLHTLTALLALGLLYQYLVPSRSLWRNAFLTALIIPIALVANVIRVTLIASITYYFGDAAGQGFMHGFASIALFAVALALIFGVDAVIRSLLAPSQALS